ncbi:MAG: DUF3419 family protein [Cyanobacteria bacterium SZAS-4]|nr:DUF3419 family protein [Cyanobacteria bacterium SZAS-4]
MFGQVREDAEVDLFLLSKLDSPKRAFVIASGGCTAFSMITFPGLKVDAVDISEAQIALVESKLEMFKTLGFEVTRDACKAQAVAAYKQVRSSISETSRGILDGCMSDLERGLNNAGWVDKRMHQVTDLFYAFIHSRATTTKLLSMCDVSEQRRFYDEQWCNWQWKLGLNVAFSRQFMTIAHGADAKRLLPPDFSKVMKRRIVRALTDVPACSNPYLWQSFFAKYNEREDALPPYLQERRWNALSQHLSNLSLTCAGTVDWLEKQPDDSIEYFGLSNILELLPPDYAAAVQKQILRCARNNAIVCVRGIFPRETPVFSSESNRNRSLVIDTELSAIAGKMDRSMFCNFYQIFWCKQSS